jgi:predicted enzyme related to lactoylglutathione lyase
MTTPLKPGAVIFAKDIALVARFYQELLGMTLTHQDAGITVLESALMQLVVHGIPKRIADSFEITTPPELREDVPVKLVFPVASLAAARKAAPALGGKLGPKAREFTARGFVACDGFDPEGNVVQFRESAPPAAA